MVELDWLRQQRWFAGKSRIIANLAVQEDVPLAPGVAIQLLRVHYEAGPDELYQLVASGSDPDELDLPDIQRLLFELIRDGQARDSVRFQRDLELGAPPVSRLLRGEQSNSSIAYEQRWILKLYRRLAPGESRDLEVGRFLTACGFPYSPAVAGAISHASGMTLGLLQRFVPHAGDGWSYVLGRLQATLRLPNDAGEAVPPADSPLLDEVERLGQITGEMHAALASRPAVLDFSPEPVTLQDAQNWLADMHWQIEQAMAGSQRAGLADIAARRSDYDCAVERLAAGLDVADLTKIQIHGDYHLGQVLKTEDGFAIIDFEGEPARPLADRRAKQSPLRDVAGMLRSLHYAAVTAGQDGWAEVAGERFLYGWLAGSRRRFVPPSEEAAKRLLTLFQLQKALYELNYELNNRPTWVHVPLRGIDHLLAA